MPEPIQLSKPMSFRPILLSEETLFQLMLGASWRQLMRLHWRLHLRRHWQVTQCALVAALGILALPCATLSQTEGGFSLGLRAGGLIGSTELTDKAKVQAGLALRHPLSGRLLWELGAGYARLGGTSYATDMALGELRFLLAKRTGRVRPLIYAGAGAARYNLKTSPPQRTADVDPLGIAGIVPAGLGLQFVLGNSAALEILGGYTYSLGDDLNGATTEKGNDVFWGLTVGLTFGHFGARERETQPVLEAPSPPVALPPVEVMPEVVELEPVVEPEPVVVSEVVQPPATIEEQAEPSGLILAPVYFATGSARVGPNGRNLIAEFVKTIEDHDVVLLEVRGYTDTRGSRGRNLRLALKRAAAVKAVLVDEGIDGWQITVRAFGETEPPGDGIWHSRRVEIVPVE